MNLKEVFQLGSVTSALRTPDQTDIAHFWADGPSEPACCWPAAARPQPCRRLHEAAHHLSPQSSLLARDLPPPRLTRSTYHPPTSCAETSSVAGHFNQIAQVLLPRIPNLTVKAAALFFAQLNAAGWDANIARL